MAAARGPIPFSAARRLYGMQTSNLQIAVSRDRTRIAFDRTGDGPPIILVVGAFNERSRGAPLAEVLASRFSVFNYDRRGRGASDDTAPYAIEREVDDLAALIAEAGGSAAVFGYSSGALLALKAAERGLPITRLAVYDPPFNVVNSRVDHVARLVDMIAAGRRGDAVEYFQTELVGIPPQVVAQFRHAPFRPALEAIAHTLVYDAAIVTDPLLATDLGLVAVPTLVMAGDKGPDVLRAAAQTVSEAVACARLHTLDGQTHDIDPTVTGAVLEEFFGGS